MDRPKAKVALKEYDSYVINIALVVGYKNMNFSTSVPGNLYAFGDLPGDTKLEYEECCYSLKMDACQLDRATRVTFSLEFLDLKMEDAYDGKTYSIWNEQCSEQGTPISKLLSESKKTDIVINARDGSIRAHRLILTANSPVFDSMFSNNYIEDETSTVNIMDMSIGACRVMLKVIYGIKACNELKAHIMELILAADKYDIVELKKVCETSLCENVGGNNVFESLTLAHTHCFNELKAICLFYLMKMGMIFELQEDYKIFLREADRELVALVAEASLKAWQAS